MKVVSVIDSFKGCATSEELNQAVLSGLPNEVWQEKGIFQSLMVAKELWIQFMLQLVANGS